jgi:predicted branched-subunit amino acid permease
MARVGGYAAGAAEPIFRIVAKGEVELDAEVVETRLGGLKPGQRARVEVAGLGEVTGTVRLVTPEVDKATRLGRVRIFLGDNAGLRIGSFARGSIVTASGTGLAVPASAVLYGPGGPTVQVVVGNRVETRHVKTGLAAWLAVMMTLLVYAGSAQLAALPLLAAGAPLWVLWATAFCANLRFVIYSAHWQKYFGYLPRWQRLALGYLAVDLNYVLFVRRFPEPTPRPEHLPYLCGGIAWNWISWQAASLLGVLIADRVPTEWGLGFAGILALLGVTYSLLSDKKSWIAAGVAALVAVAAFEVPLKLNIVTAIAASVAIGLLLDRAFRDSAPERA